jgi:hypothetical protein
MIMSLKIAQSLAQVRALRRPVRYSRSFTRQLWAAVQRASSREAIGSFLRTASSRYVASLISESLSGLNPRRLAISYSYDNSLGY